MLVSAPVKRRFFSLWVVRSNPARVKGGSFLAENLNIVLLAGLLVSPPMEMKLEPMRRVIESRQGVWFLFEKLEIVPPAWSGGLCLPTRVKGGSDLFENVKIALPACLLVCPPMERQLEHMGREIVSRQDTGFSFPHKK
jgi:hypothetical protein